MGFTLIEIVIALAILAVLVGLLIPAVQRVRAAAAVAKSTNQLRQISIASHNYLVANDGRFPHFSSPDHVTYTTPLIHLLYHLDQVQFYMQSPASWAKYQALPFQNPADPSFSEQPDGSGESSYVANALLYRFGARIDGSIPDGLSSTVNWTEQYANCGAVGYLSTMGKVDPPGLSNGWPHYSPWRRHSFADRDNWDAYPVTLNRVASPVLPPHHTASSTFLVRPRSVDCNSRILTAAQSNGLMVALMDGSVRILSPGINQHAFWALITPDGGEVSGSEW